MSQTTITLRLETRERLKAAKRGGETYDDVLNRMLDREERIAVIPPDVLADLVARWEDIRKLDVLGP